jgi:hypothetical protein
MRLRHSSCIDDCFGVDEEHSVSSGPVSDVTVGEEVDWTMDAKQGVHFFKEQEPIPETISYRIVFQPAEGDFTFAFQRR